MEEETEQQQSKNYYRLVTLLIDIGGEALRDVLLNEFPQNQLENTIQNKISLLSHLKSMKVLTEQQFVLLQETPPDPNKFDISLLVALLRNLCPHIKPVPDWTKSVPDPGDYSMGAELLRIKNIRNKFMHISTTLVPKSTFQQLWIDLAAAINRIAWKLSPECGDKISTKVVLLKGADVDPAGEKERQLLSTLMDWKTQIIDILDKKVNSLQTSLECLHLKSDRGLDFVDAVRATGDANSKQLGTLNDRVSQIAEDVSIISQGVSSMSNQAQGGGDSIPAQMSDITHIKEQLFYLRQELAAMKHQIHLMSERTQTGQQNIPRSNAKSHGGGNVGDISDREIDSIAHKIGFNWERIGTFMDYESNQIDDLKHIYRDQPVARNARMIKKWADVVASCGESPRTLLAAAFASIQNIEMAQSLVPAEQVEAIKDQEARQETKGKIKLINFDIPGISNSSRRSPVVAIGGEGGINVFDGEVTLGSLSIHSSAGSSMQTLPDTSSLPSGRSIQIGGAGSVNIYGGTVMSDNNQRIQIGQPSLFFNRTSNICRGEGIDMTDGAAKASDSKRMKTNTLSNTEQPDFFFPQVRSSDQSQISLPGCFLQIEDRRYLVHDQKLLLDAAKSVGKLCFRNMCGTCFRVGHKYVMTARHVVMDIDSHGIIPLGRGSPTLFEALDSEDVYVTFDYEDRNTTATRKFYLTSSVVFEDEVLDIAVVELKPDQELPSPFCNFGSAQPDETFIFLGHPSGDVKQLNPVNGLITFTPESKEAAVAWSREVAGIDGFAGIDKPGRILFHCSFQKGGSGSPGTMVVGKKVFVVTVLLEGYPDWFYDPTISQDVKNRVKNHDRIEQGVSMKDVYLKMLEVNRDLCNEIFARQNE